MSPKTPEKALELLLKELFNDDEFRRFLRDLEGGLSLASAVPSKNSSEDALFSEAVSTLSRRGEIGVDFFQGLMEVRPKKATRIVEVAQSWGVPLGQSQGPAIPELIFRSDTPRADWNSSPPFAAHRHLVAAAPPAAATEPSKAIRVFISYSHDSPEHSRAVLDLANRLRVDGIEAWIDQYIVAPAMGWPRWMQEQVEGSRYVVLVCTKTYMHRFDAKEVPGVGLGATWEGLLTTQMQYESSTLTDRLIPVFFDNDGHRHIPLPLRPYTRYHLMARYDELLRHLLGQVQSPAPPLGPLKTVLSSESEQSPVSSLGPPSSLYAIPDPAQREDPMPVKMADVGPAPAPLHTAPEQHGIPPTTDVGEQVVEHALPLSVSTTTRLVPSQVPHRSQAMLLVLAAFVLVPLVLWLFVELHYP